MYLDLYQFFGLIHWICCVHFVDSLGKEFPCSEKLERFFKSSNKLQAFEHSRILITLGRQKDMQKTKRNINVSQKELEFVKYLCFTRSARYKRAVKAPGNETEGVKTDTKRSGLATSYAFGNPSLPKKPSRRKKPKPIPPV